jgi:hypothetical protein
MAILSLRLCDSSHPAKHARTDIVVDKKTFRYSSVFFTTTYTSRNVFMKSGITPKKAMTGYEQK